MGYGVAMQTRSYRHMRVEERETLSLGLAHGDSLRAMAAVLRRAPSTVSRELARNAEDRNLIEVIEIPYALSRPFAAPPEVPEDRSKALQDAFMATQKDPAYLAEAEKLGIDISPIGAQEVLNLIDRMAKTPADQMKRIEKLISEGG